MSPDPDNQLVPLTVRGTGRSFGGGLSFERVSLFLVLAACFFLYAPTLNYQFVYDDAYQIVANPHVHSWRFLPVYFTQSIWSQLGSSDTNLYRPLFLVWLRLNMALFGEEPSGWHLTTVLCHVLATALVYLLGRTLLKNRAAGVIAAAVFGVHPIHVEPVAWVSGVTEPLSSVLFLGALLSYIRQRGEAEKRPLWRASSLTLFAAALLVKETAAALPFVLGAYELTIGREDRPPDDSPRRVTRAVAQRMMPYLLVLAVYLIGRRLAMGGLHAGTVPLYSSLLSLPWVWWTYVKMVVWPTGLSPSYDVPYVTGLLSPRLLLPVAGLLAGIALLWRRGRRDKSRLGLFLGAWFGLTLAPALAAFCLAYAEESMHDRYLYLPLVAFALLAGAGFARLCLAGGRWRKGLAWGLTATVLAGLSLLTSRQIGYWQSNYVLFQRAVETAPRNERAAMNFTAELLKMKEYRRALQLCQAMIEQHPESTRPVSSAALASFLLHDDAQAESYYFQASLLEPRGDVFYFLGLARMRLGDYHGAADALSRAAALSPAAPFYHYTLGVALAQLREWVEAREQFSQELQLQAPSSIEFARQALSEADRHVRDNHSGAKSPESTRLELPQLPN